MSLGLNAAAQAGSERRARRRQAVLSIQDTMRINSRLTLMDRSLPGYSADPNLMTELATSDMDDSTMMQTALDIAGDSYMMGEVEDLERMDGPIAEAYFGSYSTEMQTALRGAGYTPASEQGGGFFGSITSAISVPFSGRAKQLTNKATRLLPGVESGPFDNQSNVDMSFNALPGIIGKPLQVATTITQMPFRIIGHGLGAVMYVGDQSMAVVNRIVDTGALMADRELIKGYDENGNAIYERSFGGMIARALDATPQMAGLGQATAGWVRGMFSPSELRRAWGDANDGEDLFQGEGFRKAALALGVDEHGSSNPGDPLWVARRSAAGWSMGEMIEEIGLTPDQPEFLEKVQELNAIMSPNPDGTETPFQTAVEELSRHRISYGDHLARNAGIDPTSRTGQIAVTGSNLAFSVIADPLNFVGMGFAKMRVAKRIAVTANASDHLRVMGELKEQSDYLRRVIDKSRETKSRTSFYLSPRRLREGTNVRQIRRINDKMDRLAAGIKRYDDAAAADKNRVWGEFIDGNQDLIEHSLKIFDFHNTRPPGSTGLSTADGWWAYFSDELGRQAILETRIGGVRSDIKSLPQWSISDEFIQGTKAVMRGTLDPARAATLSVTKGARITGNKVRRIRGKAELPVESGVREFQHVKDVEETMTKIGLAEEAGTIEIEYRSLISRLKSRRLSIMIDGEAAPLDVDEFLNWTIDTKDGAIRRFARSMTQHTPTANRLELGVKASAGEMRRFFNMGAMSHMSQKTIDDYIGAFTAGTVAERRVLVTNFVADMFYRTGIANYKDNAAQAMFEKWTKHTKQAYGTHGSDAIVQAGRSSKAAIFVQKQGDDIMQIPNMTEFARATRSMNAHRMLFGVVNPNMVDNFVRKVWAPLQLMRIGFIPRAAGEEMISWMLREGPMKYVRAVATKPAAGVRRSRKTGEMIRNDEYREMVVLRPLNWMVHQMSEWSGVAGDKLARRANTRAMAHQNWATVTDEGRAGLIRDAAKEIRSERQFRNSLTHIDAWVEQLSHRGAEWGHSIQSKTRGIPSKQGIARRIANLGSRRLEGNISKVFATEMDLRIYAMKSMATNSKTSRAFADLAGGLVEPYMLQADSVLHGRNALGQASGASRNGIIPLQVDVSNFKMYTRTEDETEWLMAFSQQLSRFADEDSVMAGVDVLNKYVGSGADLRFGNYIEEMPLGHTRVYGDDAFDRVKEARHMARKEIDNIDEELLRLADDVTPEAMASTLELQDRRDSLVNREGRLADHETIEVELRDARAATDGWQTGRVQELEQELAYLYDHIGEGQPLPHDVQTEVNKISKELSEKIRMREVVGPEDADRLTLEIQAMQEEIREYREVFGVREADMDEIQAMRDELARVREHPEDFDEYAELLDLRREAEARGEIFDDLQLGERDLGWVEGDELINPEGTDRIEAFRNAWHEIHYDEKQAIQAVQNGEITPDFAIREGGVETPLGQWIVNNHQRIEMREWVALTEIGPGKGVITSREQLLDEILSAVETSLRSLDSKVTDEAVRAVLDESGRLTKGPGRGHRYTYSPMIDPSDVEVLQRLGVDASLRVQYKKALEARLSALGLNEEASGRVIQEVLNSWIPHEARSAQGIVTGKLEGGVEDVVEAGINYRSSPDTDPGMIPASFFSHPDSRVAQAISESITDLSTTRAVGPRRASFAEVEVPSERMFRDKANVNGAYDTSGGTVLSEARLHSGRIVDASEAIPMKIVSHPELGHRTISGEPEVGWKVIREFVSDGSTYDEGIKRLATVQAEEIIDNLTNFRRGGDDVLSEITAPLQNGDIYKLTSNQIRLRGGGGAVDYPQHVYGPSLINPADLEAGNIWEAIKRGAFDDVISPAINALVRQPMFLDKMAAALELNWDLRHIHGPDEALGKAFRAFTTPDGNKVLDEMVELLWESDYAGFGVALDEVDEVRAQFVTALQKGKLDEMVRLSGDIPELGHLTNEQAEIVRKMGKAKRRGHETMLEASSNQAMTSVIPFIDDHRVRSQFQGHVGGLMPFWFAEEQFMKRWARGFYQTPHMLHKAQLTLHGFREMGFVQTDADGRSVLVWPMSEYAAQIVGGVASKVPVFGKPAGIVLSQPLATDINFLFPGLNEDSPEGFSFGPGLAFELNFMTTHLPELAPFRDQLLGDMSANRWDANDTAMEAVYAHFIPSGYRAMYHGITGNVDAAAVGSAQVQAMQYLIANGHAPDESDPFEQERFIEQTRDTARIILMMRGVTNFTLGAGANPLLDSEQGDEFRSLLNAGVDFPDAVEMIVDRFGGDATAYTVFASSSQSGAPIPSTEPALRFMQQNAEFIDGFEMAAPWFLPQERPEGEYGILETRARNQALAHELRTQRSAEETLRAIYVAQAAPDYFESRDIYTQQRLTLKAQGRDDAVSQLDTQWRRWKGSYLAQHPVFNAEINTPEGQIRRQETIDEIRILVASPDLIPEVEHRDDLIELMTALSSFVDAMDSISGERSGYARDLRDQWRREFYTNAERYVQENPALSVFYNSVIRPTIGTDDIAEIEFGQ